MEFIYKELNKNIEKIMMESDEIIVITAFIKNSSIPFFEKIPHKNISIICGIDFFISDPCAISQCEKLFKSIKIFHNPSSVFHPKCYWAKSKNNEFLIIGSSNMTLGGFEKNYEASILVKKDFSNEKVFKDFHEYYKILNTSHYLFDLQSELFLQYRDKYKVNVQTNMTNEFNKCVDSIFSGHSPIDAIDELKLDDWIYHDDYGVGTIVKITKAQKDTIDVVFLKSDKKTLRWTNRLQKLKNFTNELTKDIFTLEKDNLLTDLKNKFYDTNRDEWINQRNLFYAKWKDKLQSFKLTKQEVHDFFEESATIWTLFGLKKNLLSERVDEFNKYLSILNNEKISIFDRYNNVCGKDNDDAVDGIGRAITSSILNILYPDTCPVFNNASDAVLEFFGYSANKKRGESPAEKYTRFRLISFVLKDKYKFNDLVEVDCFVGYIKVNYLKNN